MDDADAELTAKLVHNEHRKIAATLFNNIATAIVVAGIIVPAVAIAYQTTVPHGRFWLVYVVLWLVMAVTNHQIARGFLKGLKS